MIHAINNSLLNAYLDVFAAECSKGNEMDNREQIKAARSNIIRVVNTLVRMAADEAVEEKRRKKVAHDGASHAHHCRDEGCAGQCLVR